MTALNAAIEQAKKAVAAVPAPVAANQNAVAPTAARKLSADDFMTGGLNVDEFLKVKERDLFVRNNQRSVVPFSRPESEWRNTVTNVPIISSWRKARSRELKISGKRKPADEPAATSRGAS